MNPSRVLLVDDDAAALAMLGLGLRRSGFNVATAGGVEEALQRLKREHFAWLITDGRMKPSDGLVLSREAKKLDPYLRILMISAAYDERDIKGYPIEKIFSKPVDMDHLISALA